MSESTSIESRAQALLEKLERLAGFITVYERPEIYGGRVAVNEAIALITQQRQEIEHLKAERDYLREVVAGRPPLTTYQWACLACSEAAGVVNDPARHVLHAFNETCPRATK